MVSVTLSKNYKLITHKVAESFLIKIMEKVVKCTERLLGNVKNVTRFDFYYQILIISFLIFLQFYKNVSLKHSFRPKNCGK